MAPCPVAPSAEPGPGWWAPTVLLPVIPSQHLCLWGSLDGTKQVVGTRGVCGSRAGVGTVPMPVPCTWTLVPQSCQQEERGSPAPSHDSPLLSPQCMRLVFAQETPSACSDARGSAGSHVGFLRRVGLGRRGNNRQLLGGESRPSSPPTDPPTTVTALRGIPGLEAALLSLPETIPAAVPLCLSWLCQRSQSWLSLSDRGVGGSWA